MKLLDYLIYSSEWEYLLRVLIAAICGAVIGVEREKRLKNAGIRTHILVSMSACLMMVISKYGFFDILQLTGLKIQVDASRVASSVVSAIGFLGAGVIFVRKENTIGVTTAAGLWSTVGIGLALGSGLYILGVAFTLIVVILQIMLHNKHFIFGTQTTGKVSLRIEDANFTIGQVSQLFKEKKLDVKNVRLSLNEKGQDLSALIIFNKRDNITDIVNTLESIGKLTSIDISHFG